MNKILAKNLDKISVWRLTPCRGAMTDLSHLMRPGTEVAVRVTPKGRAPAGRGRGRPDPRLCHRGPRRRQGQRRRSDPSGQGARHRPKAACRWCAAPLRGTRSFAFQTDLSHFPKAHNPPGSPVSPPPPHPESPGSSSAAATLPRRPALVAGSAAKQRQRLVPWWPRQGSASCRPAPARHRWRKLPAAMILSLIDSS